MAGPVILVDTSLLIDYFRKKEKHRSMLHGSAEAGTTFRILLDQGALVRE